MHTTSPDGTSIGYRVTGDGALGVVFVHGWSSTSHFWDRVIEDLPLRGRKFAAVDLRGHGESAAAGLEHTVRRYAEDVLAVADAAGLDRFVTVGHSMGAKYAQYVRVLAPQRLLGQISITPTPSCAVEDEADDEIIALMSSMSGSPDAMAEMFTMLTKEPLPDDVVRPLAETAAAVSAEVLAESMRAFSHSDFEDELIAASSAPPTFVIGGSHDPFYPPALHESRIVKETPLAAFTVLDCGHDPLHELPRESARLIDGFLAAIQSTK